MMYSYFSLILIWMIMSAALGTSLLLSIRINQDSQVVFSLQTSLAAEAGSWTEGRLKHRAASALSLETHQCLLLMAGESGQGLCGLSASMSSDKELPLTLWELWAAAVVFEGTYLYFARKCLTLKTVSGLGAALKVYSIVLRKTPFLQRARTRTRCLIPFHLYLHWFGSCG